MSSAAVVIRTLSATSESNPLLSYCLVLIIQYMQCAEEFVFFEYKLLFFLPAHCKISHKSASRTVNS